MTIDKKVKKANQLVAEKKFKEATNLYAKALKRRGSDRFKIHFNWGIALAKWATSESDNLKKSKLREGAFRRLSAASNSSNSVLRSKSLYNLGNILFEQGHINDAIKAYRDSLFIEPGQKEAIHNLKLALLSEEKERNGKNSKAKQNDKSIPLKGENNTQTKGVDTKPSGGNLNEGHQSLTNEKKNSKEDAMLRFRRLERRSKKLYRRKLKQQTDQTTQKDGQVAW